MKHSKLCIQHAKTHKIYNTYKELKQGEVKMLKQEIERIYNTYKELKHKLETELVKLKSGFIIPIRNWNSVIICIWKDINEIYNTYKELKPYVIYFLHSEPLDL